MRKIHIIIILLSLAVNNLTANNNNLKILLPDSSVFYGEKFFSVNDSSMIYRGLLKNKNFDKLRGVFEYKAGDLQPLYVRYTNGSEDTIYATTLLGNILQREKYTNKDYFLDEVVMTNIKTQEFFRYKFYDNDKQRWTISLQSGNGNYKQGRSYNLDKHYLFDITDDYFYENLMWGIVFSIMIAVFLWIFLLPFGEIEKWYIPQILLLLSFVLLLTSLIFVDKFIQLQLVLPFLSILLVPLFFYFFKPQKKITAIILHYLLSLTIIGFWIYAQFYNLHDTTKLADGTQIELNWKSGTDILKRHVIKRMLSNMLPVPVKDHGKEYVVYVSKYEFTEGEMAVLNDDIAGWISYFLYDDVLDDFSFRESQIALQMIKNLCGVNFDFLSFSEWQSASLFETHSPHNGELFSANEGERNTYGLVNITSNVPEYTSNYCKTLKLGIATDTLFNAYNTVFVAGSAYISKDSINNSVVNKNLREGGVGFRLVYRPSDIGARRFYIKGTCRADQSAKNLPKYIKLISLNGRKIENLDNYESFEELLIENRFKDCIIEGIDQLNSKRVKFTQPSGFAFYDYEPIFSFVGMDN